MGLVTLLEFLNLGSGEGESELGLECPRTVSYGLSNVRNVEILEVPVSTAVHMSLAPGIYPSRV